MKKFATVLMVILSLVVFSAPALAGFSAQADGSGHLLLSNDSLRTFTFNAKTDAAGVTTGKANIIRHDSGAHLQIKIDCLSVAGNTATMSGFSDSKDPDLDGLYWVFRVVDDGEGNDALDQVSLAYNVAEQELTCNDELILGTLVIAGGNVQVK